MSRVALVGLPYDAGSSFQRGPADAPAVIRRALTSPASNLTTQLGLDLELAGMAHDAGDVSVPEGPGGREKIETAIVALLDREFRPKAD